MAGYTPAPRESYPRLVLGRRLPSRHWLGWPAIAGAVAGGGIGMLVVLAALVS